MAAAGKKEPSSGEMNTLIEDIRQKQFRRVYLFYGEEEYLVQQYRKELIRAVCGEEDSMNLNIHRSGSFDWSAVQDEILTMPFFASHRLVVLDDTKLFSAGRKKEGAKDGEDGRADDSPDSSDDTEDSSAPDEDNDGTLKASVAAFLPQIPDSTVVLFTEHADEKKPDGRKGKTSVDRRGKLFKAVAKNGLTVQFSSPDEQTLRKWVLGKLGAEKIRITGETLELFLSMTGQDMSRISTETEKLISCAGRGGVIRKEDVLALTSELLENQVFRMIDLITQSDPRGALELYHDLLLLKTEPNMIFYLLVRQFDQLLAAALIMAEGGSAGRVMEELGVKKWQADKVMRQARWFSADSIRKVLERCAGMQEKARSGRIDMRLGLELLIVECSSRSGRGARELRSNGAIRTS